MTALSLNVSFLLFRSLKLSTVSMRYPYLTQATKIALCSSI